MPNFLTITKETNDYFTFLLNGDIATEIKNTRNDLLTFGDLAHFKTSNGANLIKEQNIPYANVTIIDGATSLIPTSTDDLFAKLISAGFFDWMDGTGSGGVDRFDDLLDTFKYFGKGGQMVVVDESELKLVTIPVPDVSGLSVFPTPLIAFKTLRVKADASGYEFIDAVNIVTQDIRAGYTETAPSEDVVKTALDNITASIVTPTTDIVINVSTVLGETASDAFGNVITSYAKSSKGLLIGDSTIAAYAGADGIETFLLEPADIFQGSTILNQAVPGNTIDQQLAIYNADSNKTTYDWIIVQIGLNDILPTSETAATVIARYQNLINTIYSTKKATAKIIVSAMLPCKQRFIDLVGAVDGALAQQKWVDINNAIMGGGATPVINVDFRNNDHVLPLSDGNGNIAKNYNVASGDNIHENNNGRMIIASAMRKTLTLAGFFRPKSQNIFSKYFTNVGNNVFLKDGMFSIDSKLAMGTAALFIRNNVNGTNQYTQSTYAITKTDLSETQYFSLGVGNYGNGTAREENFYLFYNNPTTAVSYDLWRTDKNGNLTNKGTFTNGGNIFAPDVEITSATNNFSTALNLKNTTSHANARVGITMLNAANEGTVFYRANSGGSVLFSNAGDWVIDIAGATNGRSKFYASGNVSFGNETDNGIARVQVVGNASGTLAASNNSHFMRKGETDTALGLKLNTANPTTTGTLTTPILNVSTAPTTSSGTYDILTRNTSTGVVEKVASSALPTSGTYTPTLNAISAAINTLAFGNATYTKVGNIVTVTVGATFTVATASLSSGFTITYPFNRVTGSVDRIGVSNISNTSYTVLSPAIVEGLNTTTCRVVFYTPITGTYIAYVSFQYTVL